MKRIFLLSTLVISSFGMMNLQTVSAATPQQAVSAAIGGKAKALVSKINQAVPLRGDQFAKVNDACIEYFKQVDVLTNAKPADMDAQIASLKKTRNEKIKAALAPDQLNSWANFKE